MRRKHSLRRYIGIVTLIFLLPAAASAQDGVETKSTVMGGSLRWALTEGASGYGFQYELGFRLIPEKPLFAIIGAEYATASAKIKNGYTSTTYSSSSLNIPLTLGYRIGNPEKFDMFIQGGVRYGHLLSAKMGSQSILDDVDRSGFCGVGRVAVGYSAIRLFAEYAFPFGDGDGVWSIGVSFGFHDKSSLF